MSRYSALVLLAGLSACAPDDIPIGGDAEPTAKLARFEDCGELRDWVADAWTEQLLIWGYGYYGYPEEDAGDDGGDGGRDHSETNVQEAGIDEPDLVKTDGDWLYVAQWNGELTVVDAWPPAETAVASRLPLDGMPASLFLDGDRALVFSSVYDDRYGGEDWSGGYVTRMSLVDLVDRLAPVETRQVDVEGWLVDARRIDGDVYVVMQSYMEMPEDAWQLLERASLPEINWEASEWERRATLEEARRALRPLVSGMVAGMDIDELLPRYWDHAPGAADAPDTLLACTDVYHPAEYSEPAVLSVVHLDLREDAGPVSATGLMSSGWIVYASADHLTVAQSSGSWWTWWEDWTSTTRLHRFTLAGADTVYEASGEVEGQVPSRWAMDEVDGYLRVATTDWGWSETGTAGNNLFVLAATGEDLDVVGEVRGIAPGEGIYAARFFDEYGFLVTFEQVDPLFTLDLRDPTAPAVVGELEVPGYSAYLHPLDGDRLLAVGMDGDEAGTITGFQMSLYDVADLAAPVQLDRLPLGSDDWSWSDSLWDAHAFTFYEGVASVPVYSYDWNGVEYEGFSGMWVVDAGATTLTELGRVDHSALVAASECLYDGVEDASATCPDAWWYATMRRSVVIEGWLYSLSDYGVVVTPHRDPATVAAEALFWPIETGPL